MSTGPRRRLHLSDPGHGACEVDKGFEWAHGLFASQGDPTEAFDTVEETLDQVPLFVEQPVDGPIFLSGWITLDMGRCAQIIGYEIPQMIGIIGCIHDDVTDALQTFDQTARLRAVTPLSGRDQCSDR